MIDKHSKKHPRWPRTSLTSARSAFTIVECTVTLAIVAVLVVIVAQCLVWSLQERARLTSEQAALELAANVLEAARAQPWEKLDKTWAEAQAIPAEMEGLLPEGKIQVTVEAEPKQRDPLTRRVTVAVLWHYEIHLPPRTVQLIALFSDRALKKTGGQP